MKQINKKIITILGILISLNCSLIAGQELFTSLSRGASAVENTLSNDLAQNTASFIAP